MRIRRGLTALGLAVLLAGCLPATPTPPPATAPPEATTAPTVEATEPPPTEEAPSPTAPPATVAPPTAEPEPTSPPTAEPEPTAPPEEEEAERIALAPGTTDTIVDGELPARGSARYVLAAREGDLLDVEVSAPEPGVRLVIYGADGDVLRSGMGEGSSFRGILQSTQDYYITVDASEAVTPYAMVVSLPERIAFAPGATSAMVDGEVTPHERHAYVAGLSEGQTLEVEVSAPEPGVRLVIYGVDGTVLRSGMGEGMSFLGPVPVTQDYIVAVSAGEEGVAYTMTVGAR